MLNLPARTLCVAIAMAVVASTHAGNLPLPESGVAQITESDWRGILTKVQGTDGVDCQVIPNAKLYQCHVDTFDQEKMWTFAMEGSLPFPAVSQAILRRRACFDYTPGSLEVRPYSGPKITISRSGAYAGNKAAFDRFLGKLVSFDKSVLAGARSCGEKEKRGSQPSETP